MQRLPMTTLCYLEKGDSYFMLHRTKKINDENHDKWMGVGGHFEDRESPEECVVREVWEETGLTLDSFRFRGIITFVSDVYPTEYMHLFTADKWHGEEQVCNEGDLEWIAKEKLLSLPMWEGDRIFLKLLWRDAPFFSLKLVYCGDALQEAFLDGKKLDWKIDF